MVAGRGDGAARPLVPSPAGRGAGEAGRPVLSAQAIQRRGRRVRSRTCRRPHRLRFGGCSAQARSRARTGGKVIRRAAGAAWLVLAASACGHAIFVPPAGPGAATDASAAWAEATSTCRGAQSYMGTLRISGHAGGQRIARLAIDTAVTRSQIYMGATVSGTTIFVLSGSNSDAVLW